MKYLIIIVYFLIMACKSHDLDEEYNRTRDQINIDKKKIEDIRNKYRHEGETIYYDPFSKEDEALINSLNADIDKQMKRQMDIILEK